MSHLQHQIQSSVDVDLLWKTLTDSRWVRNGGTRRRVPAFGGCFYLFLLQVEGQSVESDAVLPVSLVTEHRQQDSMENVVFWYVCMDDFKKVVFERG